MTLLEARTGKFLFNHEDIKQEIVHTLLLEEHGVSKKCVIILYKMQDNKTDSTLVETSGPSAQDSYCARGSWGGANIWRGNGEE